MAKPGEAPEAAVARAESFAKARHRNFDIFGGKSRLYLCLAPLFFFGFFLGRV